MSLEIWYIGKPRHDEFDALSEEYLKRIKKYAPIKLSAIKESKSREPVSKVRDDSSSLLNLIKPSDFLILLDERGKLFTTIEFADKLRREWMPKRRTIFLIGGSFGLSEAIRSRANEIIALSKMVLPHQMARLVFTEQLYRAFTVLNNENYHH
ncbi:MAG: 23S rRNA (pseudouridine(1915)-N(3))-methyltransferase RlmH [Saprospiraceae bacterium]|nr:23S rRNA (pseudouridine(1915)-N(3))-methyltransferase RlmH [Saprospiraceae bacterium]